MPRDPINGGDNLLLVRVMRHEPDVGQQGQFCAMQDPQHWYGMGLGRDDTFRSAVKQFDRHLRRSILFPYAKEMWRQPFHLPSIRTQGVVPQAQGISEGIGIDLGYWIRREHPFQRLLRHPARAEGRDQGHNDSALKGGALIP